MQVGVRIFFSGPWNQAVFEQPVEPAWHQLLHQNNDLLMNTIYHGNSLRKIHPHIAEFGLQ